MMTGKGHNLTRGESLPDLFQKLPVHICIELHRCRPDQFVPTESQAVARVAIRIHNDSLLVVNKNSACSVLHESAEPGLALAQRVIAALAIRYVRDSTYKLGFMRFTVNHAGHERTCLIDPSGINRRCSRSNAVPSRVARSSVS